MDCCLHFFLKFVLLNLILRFKIYAQFVDIDGTYDEYSSDQDGYNNNNNNNNHNYNGGDYYYNNDANGPTNFNGYWSSDGNGYGYGYYPETNCLYNYVPPYFMPYMDPGFSRILSNLTPMDLQSLLNSSPPSTDQNFLSQLQTQNPQLYKQLYNAYSELEPVVQQNVQSLLATVMPTIQHFVNTMNAQGAESTPLFNQNFPKLSNFLRSPGMTAFAQQPNPFLTSVAPQPSSVGQMPNNLAPNIINPIVQNPQAQQQQSQMSPNPTLGGVGELVDGILNTVSTAVGMGGKRKK